jgi:hypothetical protein
MSTNEDQPSIFKHLGPKDRGILTKAKETLSKEQGQKDDMSSEQT